MAAVLWGFSAFDPDHAALIEVDSTTFHRYSFFSAAVLFLVEMSAATQP